MKASKLKNTKKGFSKFSLISKEMGILSSWFPLRGIAIYSSLLPYVINLLLLSTSIFILAK
jgi:hypothetical protein